MTADDPTISITNRRMEMSTSISRKCAYERDDFKVARKFRCVRLVGEAQSGIREAADARDYERSAQAVGFDVGGQALEQVVPRVKTEGVNGQRRGGRHVAQQDDCNIVKYVKLKSTRGYQAIAAMCDTCNLNGEANRRYPRAPSDPSST